MGAPQTEQSSNSPAPILNILYLKIFYQGPSSLRAPKHEGFYAGVYRIIWPCIYCKYYNTSNIGQWRASIEQLQYWIMRYNHFNLLFFWESIFCYNGFPAVLSDKLWYFFFVCGCNLLSDRHIIVILGRHIITRIWS